MAALGLAGLRDQAVEHRRDRAAQPRAEIADRHPAGAFAETDVVEDGGGLGRVVLGSAVAAGGQRQEEQQGNEDDPHVEIFSQ